MGWVLVEQRLVIEDGMYWPVTNWLDEDGDECRPEDAVAVIAHMPGDGLWLVIGFYNYRPTFH